MLVMPPGKILLLLPIIPLCKIPVVPMRLMFPIVVVNHLAMIPPMVVVVVSIVVPHLPLAPANQKHRSTQSPSQYHHRKILQ